MRIPFTMEDFLRVGEGFMDDGTVVRLVRYNHLSLTDGNPFVINRDPQQTVRYNEAVSKNWVRAFIKTVEVRLPNEFEAINTLATICYDQSVAIGWRDPPNATNEKNPLHFAADIALIHSELSEALEGDRKDLQDSHLPHRKAREVELADAFIRICDTAAANKMDLGGAVREKLEYNKNRLDHTTEERAKTNGKKY